MLSALPWPLNDPILLLKIIATIAGAFAIDNILNILVKKLEKSGELERGTLVYMRRFFQVVIYVIAILVIFALLNQDITAALAGLGVGALVIGFGLKDILENWLSGILLISGKIYTIGDVIRIGDLTGTVTDITLRTTKLKTYDRNEIIVPNSLLMQEKIINLTGGKQEAVASIIFAVDYTVDPEKVKAIIENILKNHKSVIVNNKQKREIRFVFNNKEWTNEIEALFWINDPSNEQFIKSNISELTQKEFKKQSILPPIPSLIRTQYMPKQNTPNDKETT